MSAIQSLEQQQSSAAAAATDNANVSVAVDATNATSTVATEDSSVVVVEAAVLRRKKPRTKKEQDGKANGRGKGKSDKKTRARVAVPTSFASWESEGIRKMFVRVSSLGDDTISRFLASSDKADRDVEQAMTAIFSKRRRAQAEANIRLINDVLMANKLLRKQKRKNDKDRPPQPRSARELYCAENRERFKSDNPIVKDSREVTKQLGQLFQRLDEADRKMWEERAQVEKMQRKAAIEEYEKRILSAPADQEKSK